MSVVVSDTSPLRCLHHLNLLQLLHRLFGDVYVPPAVVQELRTGPLGNIAETITAPPFIIVRAPADAGTVKRLAGMLDPGESEAIALAVELRAEALLIDEQEGRAVAIAEGLNPVGVLGLLTRAKSIGLIPELRPLIDELRSGIKFHVADSLRARVLRDAGEQP